MHAHWDVYITLKQVLEINLLNQYLDVIKQVGFCNAVHVHNVL